MKISDLIPQTKKVLSNQMDEAKNHQELDAQCADLVTALGGQANIKDIDACLTRLRVKVAQIPLIDAEKLQSMGARGVIIIDHEVQAIFGRSSDKLKSELKIWLDSSNFILD
ncbi:MAG: hypothetical protein CENE_00782 [Candidatus Celerinatantimonas neptuna]|nr:MAG: hypothetical protein CENE_00782 [Candidatus Celerinatantimonas neptuna]